MTPLLVVFAYSGMDEMIERHYATWEKSECDIILSFPVDAPCKRGGLAFDLSCHHGAPVMRRIFRTFEHVLRMNYETYWFIEADSICLGKAPQTLSNGLHGVLWHNADPSFKAKQYPHYAHGMNVHTLYELSEAARKYDPNGEQGFQDRLTGWICEENGIPMIHRPDLCYSRNALDTDEYFRQANSAIQSGIVFLHGIKHQWQLDRIKL